MKTFGITLKKTEERRSLFEKECKEAGLDVSIVNGLDGSILGLRTDKPDLVEYSFEDSIYLTPGGIGCCARSSRPGPGLC